MITCGCRLSLSNERKRFQEKIALVWRVDEDPFGGTQWPKFNIRQHKQKNANRVSCAACMGLVQVQAQTITSQERNVSLFAVDAWGTCGARERCLGWLYRGIRRNTYSRTCREIEALLDHLDQLGATVQSHLRRRSGSKYPFISHRLQYSDFASCYF